MRISILGGMASLCLIISSPAAASDKGWDDAGTVGEYALIAVAIGAPTVQGDWDGALQAGGSMLAATAVTQSLKEAFPEWRPDRSDRRSFPSQHTSVSFAAAATISNRYGWQYGLPAHIVAGFVGFSRVKANKHHVHDVLVGAAIGEVAGFLITNKRDSKVQVFPWGDTKSVGVSLNMRF